MRSFSIFQSGEVLIFFINDNSANFSGEKKYSEEFRGVWFLTIPVKKFKSNLALVVALVLESKGLQQQQTTTTRIHHAVHFVSGVRHGLTSKERRNPGNEVDTRSTYANHKVFIPVRGAVPASVQSHNTCAGSSVTGDSSTPDTLTLLASNGGPARTRNGLLGTCLSLYFTFTL